ncbi:MAG: cytochrome c peroxidase [Pseudomonadota bacterium]
MRLSLLLVIATLTGMSVVLATAADEGFAPLPEALEVDQAKAELGSYLFFDPRLSGDVGKSCASCHDPAQGWGDGLAMSEGYTGTRHFRNAPSLFNVAWKTALMWDGRLDGDDLATATRDMMTESHTMNMDSRLAQERLKQTPAYVAMFDEAYGDAPYGGRIYGAIGEFLKTIRTENAPFDLYLRGDDASLSAAALRGMDLFAGKAGCIACHTGPLLSDGQWHVTGAPDHPELQSEPLRQITMLRHFAILGTPGYMNLRRDAGGFAVSKVEDDRHAFATPSLWDVGQTAPYMHAGVFDTLDAVVDFYDTGGGADQRAGLAPLGLSDAEKADLVAFLESLTGDAPAITAPELPRYDIIPVAQD